ncbi:hypothetical protein AMD27_06800 [Acinetobacter sp. TGL-Y2]|uniref:hypothetical protein n=1 Tax=Acinetobacter sp. TGL-Y2 TaxID=1407071 RepID=UPI0007A64D3A|nr:hypothetical protein [Acinetobacter sp. TGL-Y2]AMW78621.1 hypothetical protein AMD27_06800 [Acinetobacter sp. TGL-Y2]
MYGLPKEPSFKMPKIPRLDLTIEEIKSKSDEELLKYLSGEDSPGLIPASLLQAISYELTSRQIRESSKPHWTVTPTFIVGCIASVLAAISILVTIYFSVFYKAENNDKHTDQSYAVEKNSSPK